MKKTNDKTFGLELQLKYSYVLIVTFILGVQFIWAQNPLIRDQYTADPTARVFNNKVYVYPSHDIMCTEEKGRLGWFCMEDYHVFSSEDLTTWNDHGEILNQKDVPWADAEGYSMWAPDCVEKDGKYYFYFPTKPKDTEGFTIGVAIGDNPEGPFTPQEKPIANVNGIDPNVFIDHDGQAYLYWSGRYIHMAKLNANMTELASEPSIIANLPEEGHLEGPFMFERNGKYYLTYPHVENKTERLEYAIGDSPMGPFQVTGVIMDESPTGCWTNHHSIVDYKDQWYLFYHHNDLSPDFDKNRSIRADSLSFNTDGTIKKVIPTLRGIGINKASEKLQIDRYSAKSTAATLHFNNLQNTFEGWNIALKQNDWVQYNAVDFDKTYASLAMRVNATKKSQLQIVDATNNTILAEIEIPANTGWLEYEAALPQIATAVYDLKLVLKTGEASIDWIRFKD
ncbi:carbohydrate binding protein with CBM6 domain [Leeuwenhoekiella aestuarii]|uniref:Carbohydrate binding protein with CBM6 domain n=2 Tax=Leeuwenhoekiella aestuarii TaxID=2249426 RepID=A0A4Q0NPE4_9FLAO|nr:carbohydrate binding protein with CBM6 domain [Leeuwenhoekiella aestuarii]RXG13578.1 carbohydrate binding protein with CBM6 domain [Leeuwenhoekiella aestuarii]